MNNIFLNLGFTQNEAIVYQTLLNEGTLSAGKLAAQCNIHRRSVYDVLERLCSKGVVGHIKKNNLKVYSASDPNNLLQLIKKKEEEIKEILPKLQETYNRTKSKRETIFFKGKEGIKHIFEDIIKEKKDIFVTGGSNRVYDLLKYYIPHYERERIKHNIKTKLIFDTKEEIDIKLSEIKYVDYSLGPTAINIYGNKVAIIVWSDNPYAILIDDENVALSYKQHFNMLWKIAKK